jgi:predicted TIM-barrel fold metal-dependent hydrolase
VEDNQWLLDLAGKDPFVVGIVGRLHPGSPGFADQLKRFASNPLYRGIRISSALLEALLGEEELTDFHLLAALDLELDVNGGPETPELVARLAYHVPTLRVVINHIGNVEITADAPPWGWREGIREAALYPNVFCKISALVEGAARDGRTASLDPAFYKPYIDVVWNAFGDERVIYGSNWPVSENAADYETLQRIALEYAFARGDSATRKFCSLNAARAYKWVEREGRVSQPR